MITLKDITLKSLIWSGQWCLFVPGNSCSKLYNRDTVKAYTSRRNFANLVTVLVYLLRDDIVIHQNDNNCLHVLRIWYVSIVMHVSLGYFHAPPRRDFVWEDISSNTNHRLKTFIPDCNTGTYHAKLTSSRFKESGTQRCQSKAGYSRKQLRNRCCDY